MCYWCDKIIKNEMGGHVARMKKGRHAYRVLVGKPEGKEPHERPRLRWDDKNSVYFHKWDGGIDWIALHRDQ